MSPGSVAVLADVHGVLPALDAVLAEPDVEAAERIVLPGDVASGPQPTKVLDRLMTLGDRVIWVGGNADRELVTLARGGTIGIDDPISEWAATRLRPDHVERLANLPHPVTLTVQGFGDVLFCHGSPRADDEPMLVDTGMDRWTELLRDVPDDVTTVVCGHTHMPFARLVHGRMMINPGSVGMPYGRPGAHWALLRDGAVTLRRTMFDLDAACAAVADEGYPDAAEWADFYLRARASDAEALAAFRP